MDKSQIQGIDIWNDVLKKTVKSSCLTNAPTVQQTEHPYDIQVFELLVAEALNLQDAHTDWQVTQVNHDGGIDLLGIDQQLCQTPFTSVPCRLLSVGQIKRSQKSYKYEELRNDIQKVRNYWLNNNLFQEYAPKQFLFILSTDGANAVSVLRAHLRSDLEKRSDILLSNGQLTNIQLIDAANIMKSWRLNLDYFEHILKDALTQEQMACFHDFVLGLDCSWVSVKVQAPKLGGINEPIVQTVRIEGSVNDISLNLRVRWLPPKSGHIQLLSPLSLADPREQSCGLSMRLKDTAELTIALRSLEKGTQDFGRIQLISPEGDILAVAPLKQVEICEGFCPPYFSTPNRSVLVALKRAVLQKAVEFLPFVISGPGGIGKSSLISEAMVLAAQRHYLTVELWQPKDPLHPRYILHQLFAQLLAPYMPKQSAFPQIQGRLKEFLGGNYLPAWDEDLQIFFQSEEGEVNEECVVQCMVTLLLTTARDSSVFLWMSNLHWASSKTLNILRKVIDILSIHQAMLENRVLWIMEGRSGEVLNYDKQTYYPAHWERFRASGAFESYELSFWHRTDSLAFVREAFVPASDTPLYMTYFDRLLDHSAGVPMHILELLRSGLELGILRLDPRQNYRLVLDSLSDAYVQFPPSLQDTIARRIHFYREKCGDFIDFCTILAVLDDNIPPLLEERLIRRLHTVHADVSAVIRQSGFLQETDYRYHFCHEHYQAAFLCQEIENAEMFSLCIGYYSRRARLSVHERHEFIKLQLLAKDADLIQIRRGVLALLTEAMPKSIETSLYKLLLKLPTLPDGENDLRTCQVLFLLSETLVREGSWKAGAMYLNQLLKLPREGDAEELLIRLKSEQELSNILADRLQFEEAIRAAEDGLELAETCLRDDSLALSEEDRAHFSCEKEKLLARLAVCHWFSGDIGKGIQLQRGCYESAVARLDSYSAGHVLYEIGTLALHFDPEAGVAIMRLVLRECDNIPALEQHERSLIETQLLMGELLLAVRDNNIESVHDIKLECRRLLELHSRAPHSYEYFLCLTMRGICLFLEDYDVKAAQDCFLDSLRCAVESDMPNLQWKALLHTAQMCALLGEDEALLYAKQALVLLDRMAADNTHLRQRLNHMLESATDRLSSILAGTPPQGDIPQTMISVESRGCLFIIMN